MDKYVILIAWSLQGGSPVVIADDYRITGDCERAIEAARAYSDATKLRYACLPGPATFRRERALASRPSRTIGPSEGIKP